jgi:hypothetical protein
MKPSFYILFCMGVKLPLRGETGIEDAYEHNTEEKSGCNKTPYKEITRQTL